MESIYQINYRSNSSQVVNVGGLLLDLRHVHLERYGGRLFPGLGLRYTATQIAFIGQFENYWSYIYF